MRWLTWGSVCCQVALASSLAWAQESRTVTCTFADGNQMSVRYAVPEKRKSDLPNGKIWTPADQPIVLFVQTEITANRVTIPVGAFSMYVIPERKQWTLIVNKNVEAGSKYDAQQDIVRVPMDTGELPQRIDVPEISLGHIAPQVCSIRIDFGKVGAWAEFHEK
jgi:hypothetical protein